LYCFQSCIYCDLNGVTDMNNANLPTGTIQAICVGNIMLENPRWYGFIAGTSTIVFQIKPTSCSGVDGLEAAVISDCSTPVACSPGFPGNAGNPVIVIASGLTVGNAYQLVVDGYNGAVCSYMINVLVGSTVPPPMGAISTISGLNHVCPNATVTYTIPPVQNAISYSWTSPPGSTINGGSNNFLFNQPASTGTTVTVHFGSLGGNVCVTASNACSTPISTCYPVSVTPLPVHLLPDITVCYEQLPYEWPEQPNTVIGAPGTYTLNSTPYASYLGCDSIVRQKIKILPFKVKNLSPIYLCPGECYNINGNSYCQTGSYQETLSTADGCDSLVNFNLTIIPVHAVIQKPDTITCAVPSVPLTSVGSTPVTNTVKYHWYNPSGQLISTTTTATATTGGQYSLVVSNFIGGHGCYDTAYVTVITQTTVPYAKAGAPKVLTCAQPQVQLMGSASQGSQYTYLWTASNGGNIVSGANTLTPTVNAPGTYTLHVTNTTNGCTTQSLTSVTAVNLPPTVSVTGGTFTCTNPTVTLGSTTNATSGTYGWTGPNGYTSALPNPTVNAAGNYVLVVTDSITGCTASATALVIADNAAPGATATGGTLTCTVTSLALEGTSPAGGATFSWTGPNGFASSQANPTVSTPGAYNLLVTGTNGCTSTATTQVALNNTAPGAILSVSGNLNCLNASVNLIATSTANPANLDHFWAHPDGTIDETGTSALLVVNQPGNYHLIVTNTVNGCTSTDSIVVVYHAPVTAAINAPQNITCFGLNNGSLVSTAGGGNGSFTYSWSNGGGLATNSNLSAGTYTVTISDTENCTATASATIMQPTELLANASATPQTANGTTDGTASSNPTGGTTPYTFAWSNGGQTQNITGLLPGFYTISITDHNGCVAVQTVTVNPYNCAIEGLIHAHDVTCYGEADGSATAQINGATNPLTFAWSTGSTSDTLTQLGPGQYSVSIIDGAHCPIALTFTIHQPDSLQANVSSTESSGPTTNNGTVSANPTGGTAPYTYLWNTGATTASLSNLGGGIFTATVTDANGCTAIQSAEVKVAHCNLQNGFLNTNPSCHGVPNGTVAVVLTGGSGPFTFLWSSGGTNATETGLGAGTFLVSITDANGCLIVDSTSLTQPPALVATVDSVANTVCKNTPTGAIALSATGGTGAITVLWSNGQTTPSISGLIADTYTVTVTDENQCSTTVVVPVQAIDVVPPVITADSVDVNLGPSGSITLTLQNMNATVTDNCLIASVVINPHTYHCTDLGYHLITITATDDSGNTSTKDVTVNIVDNSPPTLICPPSIIHCAGDDLIQYDAPTATDNCLGIGGGFALDAGLPSGSVFPEGTTTNVYSYTDGQGNKGSCSFEVTILSQLKVKVDTVINDINHQHVGSIHVSVNGSLSPYHFQWFEGSNPIADTTQNLTGAGIGVYHVLVTDANGCTAVTVSDTITSVLATHNPDWSAAVGIYPNPTPGNVTVVLPDQLSGMELLLSVIDQTGRKVFEQETAPAKQHQLDLSRLATGMYYLQIKIDGDVMVRKVVINR
jgi:hypothetical protein